MEARLLVDCRCTLGEGLLWHPGRAELFWFDIPEGRLFACDAEGVGLRDWRFDEPASAAAWVDRRTLLVATASAILRFDIETGDRAPVCPLEADRPETRSNDGRADPAGGFWIGTMGRRAEPGLGAIRRVACGRAETLFAPVTIPNAICFAPDGAAAYYADTAEGVLRRVPIGPDGRPSGPSSVFASVPDAGPDGAVCDAAGDVWNAQWDGWRVRRYRADGAVAADLPIPAARPTCVAFGGPGLSRLYVTTAREGLSEADLARQPGAGGVFVIETEATGQAEPRASAV